MLLHAARESVEVARARMARKPSTSGSAFFAAATAASTSSFVPCATRERLARGGVDHLEGLAGLCELTADEVAQGALALASHASASLSLSGAGPYSMLSKISATVTTSCPPRSRHWLETGGGVAACGGVPELALDVGQQAAGADAEQVVV